MLLPLAFCAPCTYWTLANAARMRHVLLGVDPQLHRASMALVYGIPW